ncbi:MAG: AAA family ATPase, partial [Solirubrobacteraceae bacterium]
GKVGEMSQLINDAFRAIEGEAGKTRTAYLILDEADSLTASRSHGQSHHEDKVAVNTLIQRIDDLRRYGGRILVFLCTNRFEALDPAILRRAFRQERFDRPSGAERLALFEEDLDGLDLDASALDELVKLTGPTSCQPGFTFSDLRTRLLPDAAARAFPDRPLSATDLLEAAKELKPTPAPTDPGDAPSA